MFFFGWTLRYIGVTTDQFILDQGYRRTINSIKISAVEKKKKQIGSMAAEKLEMRVSRRLQQGLAIPPSRQKPSSQPLVVV